jgi:hypothetical protein
MMSNLTETLQKKVLDRALPDGGFPSKPGGKYRPDATAWAVLAFSAAGVQEDLTRRARAKLAASQMDDGRLSLSQDYPNTFWPTALAILAWQNAPRHLESQMRGVDFLLATAGKTVEKTDDSIVADDTALRGWPWIEETYSWVEPTSLVLLSLEATGKGNHERAHEARRMLLDRQMESGGWNYGNTKIFGQQLWPMPESTGLALNALAGRTEQKNVKKSILYLKQEMGRLRTPLSFAWGYLGLSAWGERPLLDRGFLQKSLRLQERYVEHETEQLALLLICLHAPQGLLSVFERDPDK